MHDQTEAQVGGRSAKPGSLALGPEEVARNFTSIDSRSTAFQSYADACIRYQRESNPVYAKFAASFPDWDVPFLPVEAFKHTPVASFPSDQAELVFESSGTTSARRSRHYVRFADVYRRSVVAGFVHAVGQGPYDIVGHLPSFSDANKSSLAYMVEHLVRTLGGASSGLFLDDVSFLDRAIRTAGDSEGRLVVFGTAFGLLDLLEVRSFRLPPGGVIIETGGMKTYRREVGRSELHAGLAAGFGVPESSVLSEYGMCELLTQCYTRGGRVFYPPPWMEFAVVDPDDPTLIRSEGDRGALAVVDLANVYSASALLTQDAAIKRGEGFEVLGRLTGAELRGCNFLLESVGMEKNPPTA